MDTKYIDINFEINYSEDGKLWLYIDTKVNQKRKEWLRKIKKNFKAKDVLFIKDGIEPNMWSIRLE